MQQKIKYGSQFIDKRDISLVAKSLVETHITTGNFVKKFEASVSKFLKAKYVLTCNSGTSALHLAFCALKIKKNDIVIMPAINFVSGYNMCKILGAKIYLADVDAETGQMTPETLIECIKKNNLKKIKVILTMYMGGYPENIIKFYRIKKKFKCFLIEDACHAFGAKYSFKKKPIYIGSCKHCDISTFSLHPLKSITTGEGGLVTTNNLFIAKKLINLRSHGIIKNPNSHWKYDVITSGFNYRLSDINCALGLSQLKKIKSFLKSREKIYNFYKQELDGYKNVINFPKYNIKNKPSFHLVLVNINFNDINTNKDNFLKYLLKNNIISQYHYIPIYKFKVFKNKINIKKNYPSSNYYFKNSLSIPIHVKLKNKQLIYVINKIKYFIDRYK